MQCFETDSLDELAFPSTDPDTEVAEDEATTAEFEAARDNVVLVEIYACADELERNYEALLPYLFACNAKAEYVVMTLPTRAPDYSILERFVRVPERKGANLPQQLFVMHKLALAT